MMQLAIISFTFTIILKYYLIYISFIDKDFNKASEILEIHLITTDILLIIYYTFKFYYLHNLFFCLYFNKIDIYSSVFKYHTHTILG